MPESWQVVTPVVGSKTLTLELGAELGAVTNVDENRESEVEVGDKQRRGGGGECGGGGGDRATMARPVCHIVLVVVRCSVSFSAVKVVSGQVEWRNRRRHV